MINVLLWCMLIGFIGYVLCAFIFLNLHKKIKFKRLDKKYHKLNKKTWGDKNDPLYEKD